MRILAILLHILFSILYFYDLLHILLSPWLNFGSMECITYVCIYVISNVPQVINIK